MVLYETTINIYGKIKKLSVEKAPFKLRQLERCTKEEWTKNNKK